MMDQHFDRNYQAGRAELNAGIDALGRRLFREAAAVFHAIHNANFSAPWADPRSR